LERLDEQGGVLGPDESVVDLVLGAMWSRRADGKACREAGGIEVQHEFVELRAYSTGEMFQLFDERCLGEVLPYDDVESAAEVFSG
jgi:hypothetical protein